MRIRFVTHAALLVVVTISHPTLAEEKTAQEHLKAWGDAFEGTWVNEQEVDADLPGIAKKGDILRGEVTYERAGNLYRATWKGTVNGKASDSGIGVVGWDAAKGGVRIRWFSNNGSNATDVLKFKKNGWRKTWQLTSPDGVKSSNTGKLTITKNQHQWELSRRKRGMESLPDQTRTWIKQPKQD